MMVAYIDPNSGGLPYLLPTMGSILALVAGLIVCFWRWIRARLGSIGWKRVGLGLGLLGVVSVTLFWLTADRKTLPRVIFHPERALVQRVIVVGIDGMDPRLTELYIKSGLLPNFSKLSQLGCYGRLETSNPPHSPVAWSCFATGRGPGGHGICDFIRRWPETYGLDMWFYEQGKKGLTRCIQTPCVWDMTSIAKLPSFALRCPVTFPAWEINGRMLSGLGVPDLDGTMGRYAYWSNARMESSPEDSGHLIPVTIRDNHIESYIPGPCPSGEPEERRARLVMNLEIKEGTAEVRVEDQTFTLRVGEWSDWKRLTFKLDMFRRVAGICRFRLVSVTPEFRLYATPIQFDPIDPAYTICHPPSYSRELARAIGTFGTLGMAEDVKALSSGRLDDEAFLQQCDSILDEREKQIFYQLERFQDGLFVFVFDTPDRIQHMFWRAIDPEHSQHQATSAAGRGAIEAVYRRMDRVLGRVMEHLTPQTALIVCSDHGFTSFRRAVHLNRWLAQNGYLTLKNGESFNDIDWSRTRAYAVGFGGIYLNLAGREGKGVVQIGEAESLKREIASKLQELTDGGRRAIRRVYDGAEIFQGEQAGQAPDLYVGFDEGYRASWQTALGGAPATLIDDNTKKWSGDHLVDPSLVPGVLFCSRAIKTESARIVDLTPTILDLLGLESTIRLDGRSLVRR